MLDTITFTKMLFKEQNIDIKKNKIKTIEMVHFLFRQIVLKGVANLISTDPSFIEWHVWFTTVLLKDVYNIQVLIIDIHVYKFRN